MKKLFIIIVIFLIATTLGALYLFYSFQKDLQYVTLTEDELIIEIPRGTSLSEAVELFNENDLLRPDWKYKLYLKVHTRLEEKSLVAGIYRFEKGTTIKDIIKAILSGKNQYFLTVTYPEGISVKEFAKISERKLNIPKQLFLDYVYSKSTLKKHGIKSNSPEGYLMPNTYQFGPNVDAQKVIDRLISTLMNLWNNKFAKQAKMNGWSMHKTLTLASIIEAETPVSNERPRVSGVYHNRLKKGMLLQADPTVQYALGGKKRLLYRDLEVNNPYNTYRFLGLPPGPINSPGESSIAAALIPEEHDYYYFVAVGDGTNRHNFSKNLTQHNNYVREYRRRR